MSGPFPSGLPTKTMYVKCFNIISFYGEELLAPCPTPKLLVGCPRLLIQYTHSYPPYLETVLPQPEDTPCHCDRDPLIMDQILEVSEIKRKLL